MHRTPVFSYSGILFVDFHVEVVAEKILAI